MKQSIVVKRNLLAEMKMASKDMRRKVLRAFVIVTVKAWTSQGIVGSRRIKGVKMANSVLGRFDAVVVIEAESLSEINKIFMRC